MQEFPQKGLFRDSQAHSDMCRRWISQGSQFLSGAAHTLGTVKCCEVPNSERSATKIPLGSHSELR